MTMTSVTRRDLVDVYGALLKAGWDEPTIAAELEPSQPTELDLRKVALAIKRLQRLGEL